MSRLNYDFDKEPLERRNSSAMMRRGKIIAIFCAVAVVTGGLIYALVPHQKAETEKKATPVEKSAETLAAPTETPEETAQKNAVPSVGEKAKLPIESEAEAKENPEEKDIPAESKTPKTPDVPETPADPSGKGVVLPSDPPASQDQPIRAGSPAGDLDALKKQAASGDLNALTKAFAEAAPGSEAKVQYGLALGAARMQAWQNGSWKKEALFHLVVSGDNLTKLAKRHHTTIEFIQYVNKLKNNNIRIGQKLAILPGPWSVQIEKKTRLLTLTQIKGDTAIPYGAFEIGIGRGGRTPKGNFVISYRLYHPDWHTADGRVIPYGDKENVLGDYFLKLAVKGKTDKPLLGYGIHGTNDETTVGRSLSNGCIRMHREDVEMLYYLLPSGTPVTITE